MTPPTRTWQRIIHEIRLAGGSLPAHIALRRAGYCGDPTGLTSATRHEPRLCEWTGARNVIWLGIVDGDGELPCNQAPFMVECRHGKPVNPRRGQ
jgi:hypothetical protein